MEIRLETAEDAHLVAVVNLPDMKISPRVFQYGRRLFYFHRHFTLPPEASVIIYREVMPFVITEKRSYDHQFSEDGA